MAAQVRRATQNPQSVVFHHVLISMIIRAKLKKQGACWEDCVGGVPRNNSPALTSPGKPLLTGKSPHKKKVKIS